MSRRAAVLLALLCALSACGGRYRAGTDGSLPGLMQNQPANAQPQPAGSMNF